MDIITNGTGAPRAGAAASSYGFTLIELLVTVAVAAVLATVAVPSMHRLLLAQRMSTQVNTLVAHLSLGRSEAVMRNLQVVMCKSANGQSCDGSARWHQGWILFVDGDRNEHRGPGEPLLRRHGPLPSGMSMHYGGFPSDRYVTFEPTGISNANGTFVLCDGRGAPAARAVIVSKAGRARSARRRPGGGPLQC